MDKRSVTTVYTNTAETVDRVEAGVSAFIASIGRQTALARLPERERRALIGAVFYSLGEVLERQFYPSDRVQCQEVGREFHRRASLPTHPETVFPEA